VDIPMCGQPTTPGGFMPIPMSITLFGPRPSGPFITLRCHGTANAPTAAAGHHHHAHTAAIDHVRPFGHLGLFGLRNQRLVWQSRYNQGPLDSRSATVLGLHPWLQRYLLLLPRLHVQTGPSQL